MPKLRQTAAALISVTLLALAACDSQRIEKLEEGVATEADVRKQFGEPAAVFNEPDGARTFEYPRQPEGKTNYFITIGADGKMSKLRQVLTEANFAKVSAGQDKNEVRRALGRPAKTQIFELKKEEVWDWRFVLGNQNKEFSVVFDMDGRVLRTETRDDQREANNGR